MIVITGPMSSTRRPSASRRRSPRSTASRGGDRLGDGEADRAVHAHAPVGRLLHDADPDRRGRELDDDVRRERGEVDALVEHPVGRSPERRVRLHREAALAPAVPDERRLEQPGPGQRHLLDDRPGDLDLGPLAVRLGDGSRARPPVRPGPAFQTSWTIVGLAVAPTAPKAIAYSSSSTAHESFQMSVGVSAIVRASGVASSVSVKGPPAQRIVVYVRTSVATRRPCPMSMPVISPGRRAAGGPPGRRGSPAGSGPVSARRRRRR